MCDGDCRFHGFTGKTAVITALCGIENIGAKMQNKIRKVYQTWQRKKLQRRQ